MKKFISMLTATAIVLSLGVVSFAASAEDLPSVTDASDTVTATVVGDDVATVHLETVIREYGDYDDLLDEIADDVKPSDVTAIETFYFDVYPDGDDGNWSTQDDWPYTLTFVRGNNNKILAVYLATNNHDFEKIDFTQNGSKITIKDIDSWGDIVFVVGQPQPAQPSTPASTGKNSAQTGYSEIIYIIAAAALVGGAVFCFENARKTKVTEA